MSEIVRVVEPLLLRPTEAARLLSVGRSTLYELVAKGAIPGVIRVGRSIRFSLKALQKWIEEQSTSHPSARGDR